MLSRASSLRGALGGAKSFVAVAARAALSTARPPPLPDAAPTTAYDGWLAFARDGYKQAAANATPVGTTGLLSFIELPAGLPELVETCPPRLKQLPESKNLLFVRKDVQERLRAPRRSADVALLGGSGTGKSGTLTVPALDWMSRRTRAEGAAQAAKYECVPGDLFVHVHNRRFIAFLRDDDAELGFKVEETLLRGLTAADVELELLARYPSLNEESSRYLFDPGHGAALTPAFSAVPLYCGAQTVIAASLRAVSDDLLNKRMIHKIKVTDPDRPLFRDYAAALGLTDKEAALVELLRGCNLRALVAMDETEALQALSVLANRIGRFGSTEINNTLLTEADHAALSSLIVGYNASGKRVFRPLILDAALGDMKRKVAVAKAAAAILSSAQGAAEISSSAAASPTAQILDEASEGLFGALLSAVGVAGAVAARISPPEAKLCTIAKSVLEARAPAVAELVKMCGGSESIEEMDAKIAVLTGTVEALVTQQALEESIVFN